MFLGSTQTPRNTLASSSLYIAPVRAKLVRLFYSAFNSEEIARTPNVVKLETVLLNNTVVVPDNHPVYLLSLILDKCLGSITASVFAARLLAFTPISEESKPWRLTIRDLVLTALAEGRGGLDILMALPLEGVFLDERFQAICCPLLRVDSEHVLLCIDVVLKALSSCVSIDAPKCTKLVLTLAVLILPSGQRAYMVEESLSVLSVRQKALTAISVAVSLSTDPISILQLRSEEKISVGQSIFQVLFTELLLESHSRHYGLPQWYQRSTAVRVRRIRDSTAVLVRLASQQVEASTKSQLGEYAVLVPSLFGLVKSILAKAGGSIPETAEIDAVVVEMTRGDLTYIKELGAPELAGTAFEIEHSSWPPLHIGTNS